MGSLVTVTKTSPPVLVAPAKPTPAGDIPLTSTDKSRLFVPFTSLHVFERPIQQPAETIGRALSQALVHYYPVAGRLAVGASGAQDDVHLACTGEGVAFVSATASCTLEDARFLHAPLAIPLGDLAVRYAGPGAGLSDPLLMMQVTEFACGGFVAAVTWNHVVTDASGLAQFLRAVGEVARGRPSPSVAPVRHDASFPDIPQLASAVRKRSRLPPPAAPRDYAYCDFTVPRGFIDRVKEEFGSRHAGARPCTSFEVVTAAVWRCRTRAINAAHGDPAPLVFAANVSRLVGAKDGYYGNCVFSQLVEATVGQVADGAVVDVVRMVKDAKERIPDALAGDRELDDELLDALCGGHNLLVASTWGGIGLDGVNLGSGRPARVLPYVERPTVPLCFPCLPCSRTDHGGANVVASCVTQDHLDAFLAELASLLLQ